MKKIHLFHFNKDEVAARKEQLESLGIKVNSQLPHGAIFFKSFKENLPDAIVIDLSRAPSQGRDIGVYMRHTKATRFVPLVFVGGQPDKVKKAKEQLPDAVYTSWDKIETALKSALVQPVKNPVVPASAMAGYSGAPLPKKLGIKENMVVGLVHAPDNISEILGDLPCGVSLTIEKMEKTSLLLWFLRSMGQLETDVKKMVEHAEHARIWMIWPKKTSPLTCDLTQQHVRNIGLAAGLVDYKVCAVDETWSGLLFTKRKK